MSPRQPSILLEPEVAPERHLLDWSMQCHSSGSMGGLLFLVEALGRLGPLRWNSVPLAGTIPVKDK